MAKDVIHYDTQCMEALHAELGRIRKNLQSHATTLRMINLVRTGADIHTCRMPSISLKTTGTRVSSGLTPIVLHRSASAISDLAEYIEVLQRKLLRVAEMFEACERDLANTTMEDYPESLPEVNPNNTKEEDLAEILKMLRNVLPPDQLASVKYARNELLNPLSFLSRDALAFFTGNYADSTGPATYLYGKTMYAFNSFFDGLIPEDFKMWSVDDVLCLVPGTDEYRQVVNLLEMACVDGAITGALNLVDTTVTEHINTINQMRLLQSMDKDAVIAQANVYKQSSDISMVIIGYTMDYLINAKPQYQMMVMQGKTNAAIADDVACYLTDVGIDLALVAATGGASEAVKHTVEVVTKTLGLVSGFMDATGNMGSLPGLSNNVIYSAEIVNDTYKVYQDAMSAYDANPSESNLEKAIDAYNSYQQASANSMNAMSELSDNSSDSIIGRIIGVDKIADTSWIEAQRDHHRQQAENMSKLYDQYKSK